MLGELLRRQQSVWQTLCGPLGSGMLSVRAPLYFGTILEEAYTCPVLARSKIGPNV